MRRSFWLAVAGGLVLTTGAVARGQAPAAPLAQPAEPAPWANKFFLPDIASNREQAAPPVILHNFGEVPHGTLCVKTFTVTNIYDVPMQITDVRKSCTCLDYVPVTRELKPNEAVEFTVTMNTGKFVGLNSQTFFVTFGPKFVSTAVVRVSATSRTDVSLNPGTVAFGQVPEGATPTQSLSVKYSGRSRDWKLTEVVPGTGPFDVKFSEVSRGGPFRGGAEYQVEVLKPGTPPGPFSGQVSVKTNDANYPVVQIAVTGSVAAPLQVAPSAVRFEDAAVGEPSVQRVIVRGGKPFQIVGVDGAADGLKVDFSPAASAVQYVTITFTPTTPGTVSHQLRVRTDLDGGTATIPVEATAK